MNSADLWAGVRQEANKQYHRRLEWKARKEKAPVPRGQVMGLSFGGTAPLETNMSLPRMVASGQGGLSDVNSVSNY